MKRTPIVIALALFGAVAATGQDGAVATNPPNACELLSRTDLQAFLPGADVAKTSENLSPLSRGVQYVASCLYRVDLDAASGDGPRPYVSLAIVRWQGATATTNSPEEGMAELFAEFGETAPTPPVKLAGTGDEAFSLQVGQENRVCPAGRFDLPGFRGQQF